MIAQERLEFVDIGTALPESRLCDTVYQGLTATPKSLPPRLFYDHAGSELFEAITDLPEYYPTRTEAAILERYAAEICASVGGEMTLVEFGSGSSRKTRLLFDAVLSRQKALRYVPIDISRAFLRTSAETLLGEYPGLSVTALAGEYFDAASTLPAADEPRLILFLGSNIGNLAHEDATEFLRRIRGGMNPHDRVLVGTDMVKDRTILERAYDDAQGVTARFNLNLLARINREIGGEFDLERFRHSAPYDESRERIEMRLVSIGRQTVRINDLETDFKFEDGEPIVTEWSQKYTPESFAALCAPAGLQIDRSWTDERGWFTQWLLKPKMVSDGS